MLPMNQLAPLKLMYKQYTIFFFFLQRAAAPGSWADLEFVSLCGFSHVLPAPVWVSSRFLIFLLLPKNMWRWLKWRSKWNCVYIIPSKIFGIFSASQPVFPGQTPDSQQPCPRLSGYWNRVFYLPWFATGETEGWLALDLRTRTTQVLYHRVCKSKDKLTL